jgi:hypothetical protein
VVDADQEPVDVKLDIIWEFLKATTGSGVPTPEDALKQRGEASAWVSTDSDTCAPYATTIEVTFDPNCTPTQKEKITLTDFRWENGDHDLKQGLLVFSGKCNINEAAVTRF